MPGQPDRAMRVSWPPRQFTLENCRLPLTLPQSSSEFRNTHVFAEPTLRQNVVLLQYKNLSSLCRNCGGVEFLVEVRGKLRNDWLEPCRNPTVQGRRTHTRRQALLRPSRRR